MGALQLTLSRAGTIRRVIRRGSQFICGLCRSVYGHEGQAQGCIQGCWTELMALDPVIMKRRVVGVAYRCRFCARDYAKRQDAATCAGDCKVLQLRLHEAEQSLTDQSEDRAPRKRPLKVVAPKAAAARITPVAHRTPRKVQPKDETSSRHPISVDVMDTSTATAAAAASAKASDSGSAMASETEMLHGVGSGSSGQKKNEVAVAHGVGSGAYGKKATNDKGKAFESGPNKMKTSDAFYRDGARYVCNSCHAKYFTRGEVEACFAGHK